MMEKNQRIFSAPGRTELAGNHTDHNRGLVLAAAIHLDTVAVVTPRDDRQVFFCSDNFPCFWLNLAGPDGKPDLAPKPQERGSTQALIRGIAAGFAERGVETGGFNAEVTSGILPGSGLSSSAAVEVLIAKIFDSLYGKASGDAASGITVSEHCSPLELACISQKAENDYFGKPCGLMDQAACAFGGVVAIDCADPAAPLITPVAFDPPAQGYALCVVNTCGSHTYLTPDYAAIPAEMSSVARYFGTEFLREVEFSQVLSHAGEIRKTTGDRALLRAIHFFNENSRVEAMIALLENPDSHAYMGQFLEFVNESGDSSWELLQNLYPPGNSREQGLSLALALSKTFFRERGLKAACRVHGGGFAGTIEAYIPVEAFEDYRKRMEILFGSGAVTELHIRPLGAMEIVLLK